MPLLPQRKLYFNYRIFRAALLTTLNCSTRVCSTRAGRRVAKMISHKTRNGKAHTTDIKHYSTGNCTRTQFDSRADTKIIGEDFCTGVILS